MEYRDKISLPSWYLTEKETYKTINKLVGSKELEFYLKNPDPFIRRLAILRVGQFKQKASYILLNSVLDDKLESEENRQLAALLMQKLNRELNLEFFISNSYLSRYTGEENVDQLLNITVVDPFPDFSFHFENTLIESQLNFDNEFLKSGIDEKDDEFPYSYKDWIRQCLARIWPDIKKGFKKLLSGIVNLPKRLSSLIQSRRESKKQSLANEKTKVLYDQSAPKTKKVRTKRPKIYVYRPPLGSTLKSLFRKFLNILFLPFRLVFHFKWLILASLVIVYAILSFTEPGQKYLFRTSPQMYYKNTNFIREAKTEVIKLVNRNETLSAVLGTATAPPARQEEPKAEETFSNLRVTAPKGLYLRSEPLSTAKKLVLMNEGMTVELVEEGKKDSSGVKWAKIRTGEGTEGWANAEWLKEVSK